MALTAGGRRDGYTLIEAMLAVAVVGVLALTVPRLLVGMRRFFLQGTARAEVQRDARVALDQMNRTIRLASAATISVAQDAGQPPYSKISLTTVDGKSVTFTVSGRRLLRVTGAQSQVLADNVEYLAFTYPKSDDNAILSIAMTLRKSTYGRNAASLETTVSKVRVMNP